MANDLQKLLYGFIKNEIIKDPTVVEKLIKEKFKEIKEEFFSNSTVDDSDLNDDLYHHYCKKINETFIHNETRNKYLVIDIVVNESEKNSYTIIYFDKQTKTRLCRSLIDFHSNFKIVAVV